jgi:hypothetical protein
VVSRKNLCKSTLLCLLTAIFISCQKEAPKSATPQANTPAQPQAAAPTSAPANTQANTPASSQASAPAAAPASAAPVIASAQYSADPDLRCDLLEVKRISGGAVMIRWRVVNTRGSGQSGLVAGQQKPIDYGFSWEQLYYIDPAENKKYNFLTDADGQRILDVWSGSLDPGQQRASWAKFPAPPATTKKISINIPKFPPFEDVALAD